MFAGLLLALLSQVDGDKTNGTLCNPDGPVMCKSSQLAFFEFAPASGAGMGTACACTTPTGAKGEALTFTRASSGTCLKGGTVTGVNNGDMVTCSTNQPRVGPGGDGTGSLKLLMEAARTNTTLKSEQFDDAAWAASGLVVAAPTVTANFAAGPDGTTTAERVQIPATTGAQFSVLKQTGGCALSADAASLFIRGNGTSGTIQLVFGSPTLCATCSYVSGSWTRCSTGTGTLTSLGNFIIGNDSNDCGGGAAGAQDVLLSGAQCEAGAYSTSYIATTTVTVARAAENATAAVSDLLSPTVSMAATIAPDWTGTTGVAFGVAAGMKGAGANTSFINFDASGTNARYYDGTHCCAQVAVLAGTQRYAGWSDATSVNTKYGSNSNTQVVAAVTDTMTATACIGSDCSGSPFDGWVGQICISSDPTRCR